MLGYWGDDDRTHEVIHLTGAQFNIKESVNVALFNLTQINTSSLGQDSI